MVKLSLKFPQRLGYQTLNCKMVYIQTSYTCSLVSSADIVHIYCALIRSILEYASAVLSLLTYLLYLACYLENVQKRPLSIVWPGISYETALDKAALSTLSDRRTVSCIKFIGKVRPGNPLYPLIHNRVVPISTSVCLRSGSLVGQWPQGLNVSQILLVLNINLVNQCSVLAYISQLVRYPTIQSSDYKRDNPATSDLI